MFQPVLHLASAQVSGRLDSLSALTRLTGIHLRETSVCGIVTCLPRLTQLVTLSAQSSQITPPTQEQLIKFQQQHSLATMHI